MTHIRRICVVPLLLFAVMCTYAGNRTAEQAKKAAQTFIVGQMSSTARRAAPKVPSLQLVDLHERSSSCCYLFSNGERQGYILISGDDRMPEVIAYASEGDINEMCMSEGLQNFISDYDAFIRNATDEQIAEIAALREKSASRINIAPLMSTDWQQDTPYNSMCPKIRGERTVPGCVATAFAQIMKYYNYPSELKKGIPAYRTSLVPQIDIPAIPAGEKYDWDNMLDRYVWCDDYTSEQIEAVSKLMFHIGASLKADYGRSTSAKAYPAVLVDYFGMDPELTRAYNKAGYTVKEWDNLVYSEMAAHHPAFFTGDNANQGHAFVIHGYKDGLYCINWGSGNEYWDLSILHIFGGRNEMVVMLPDNGIADKVNDAALRCEGFPVGNFQEMSVVNGLVEAKVHLSLANSSGSKVTKYVSVGYKDCDGNIVNVGSAQTVTITTSDARTISSGSYNGKISFAAIENRPYNLIAIESNDCKTWIPCNQYDYECSIVLKIVNGEVKLTNTTTLSVSATLSENSSGYAGTKNGIDINVTNTGDKDYYDIITIYVSSEDSLPEEARKGGRPTTCYNIYDGQGFTVPVGGTFTRTFTFTPETAGEYNVWVMNGPVKDKNVIGHYTLTFEEVTSGVTEVSSLPVLSVKRVLGGAYLYANSATNTTITTLNGTILKRVRLNGKEITFVALGAGVYIVNNKKITIL